VTSGDSGTVRELNMMASTLFTADNVKVLSDKSYEIADHHYTAPHGRLRSRCISNYADIAKAKRIALKC
jgi:hypothetical protein